MPATDLALLVEAAKGAGDIALSFSADRLKTWDKPGDEGPVTEADIAVNDHLHSVLMGARPDYGWLSEESEDTPGQRGAGPTFVIDPIDGTRSYAQGETTWSHSIAVVEPDGKVSAAVVYLPARGKLYEASVRGGARLNGKPIRATSAGQPDKATVLATRPNLEASHWPGGVPGFRRSYRPSLAYRLALVAEGRYDAMLTLRGTWEWDVAAGVLLCQEAGALASDRAGAQLRFNNPVPKVDGVVAGSPVVHDDILRRLRP